MEPPPFDPPSPYEHNFAPRPAAPQPGVPHDEQPIELKSIGNLAIGIQSLTCMMIIQAAAMGAMQAVLSSRWRDAWIEGSVSRSTNRLADAAALLGLGGVVMFLASAIMTMIMLKRMADNGAKLQPDLAKYNSMWVIFGWFVPLMNLFRPYQMIKQIWSTIDPRTSRTFSSTLPTSVTVWWASFVALSFAQVNTPSAPWTNPTYLELADEAAGIALVSGIEVIAGLLFVVVIRRLAAHQESSLEQLRSGIVGFV